MTQYNNEKYSLSVGEDDLARMTLLGNIYMPDCADFLVTNGLKKGLKVADVGCGPGNVSLWLAEQVGSEGTVISIDNSDEQLSILDKRISVGNVHNIITCKMDIYELEQIEERFDLIFCRFLLIHLTQPLTAIQKLRDLLNPGGCLVLAELDNSTWFSYPESDILQRDTDLLCKVSQKKGSDFYIGPKLYGYLRQQHFHSISVKIVQPVLFDKNRDYLVLKCKAWIKTYLEYGLIGKEDIPGMISQWHNLIDDQENLLAGARMYLTCGRK